MLVALAAAVAIVVAIGYGFIATNIASPVGNDLGTVEVPDEPGAEAVLLDDGRPGFVVRTATSVHVLDARVPREPGSPGRLAAWCDGFLYDPLADVVFAPDGRVRWGEDADGLAAYDFELTDDGRAVVGHDSSPAGRAEGERPRTEGCDYVVHAPEPQDLFDPSVAAKEEPPGWIWLEGRLQAVGDEVMLCDDPGAGDCSTGAAVPGIDPAKLPSLPGQLNGYFLGRVGDGVLDELYYVLRG